MSWWVLKEMGRAGGVNFLRLKLYARSIGGHNNKVHGDHKVALCS